MSIKGVFQIDKWDFKSESVLADLPAEDLKQLTANKTEQFYKKGELLFRKKPIPLAYFISLKGK